MKQLIAFICIVACIVATLCIGCGKSTMEPVKSGIEPATADVQEYEPTVPDFEGMIPFDLSNVEEIVHVSADGTETIIKNPKIYIGKNQGAIILDDVETVIFPLH